MFHRKINKRLEHVERDIKESFANVSRDTKTLQSRLGIVEEGLNLISRILIKEIQSSLTPVKKIKKAKKVNKKKK